MTEDDRYKMLQKLNKFDDLDNELEFMKEGLKCLDLFDDDIYKREETLGNMIINYSWLREIVKEAIENRIVEIKKEIVEL